MAGVTRFYVEKAVMQMHCADLGFSYTSFIEELTQKVSVREGIRKDLLHGTNGPSMRVNCLCVTMPIADAPT